MKNDTKKIAAIAAVMSYIRGEEDMIAASVPPPEPAPMRTAPTGLWGLAGRQDIMQMGNMMQMKAFHSVKFR